jgi:hypothetical protein
VEVRGEHEHAPMAVAALRDQLETFWSRALDGYLDVVEQETEEQS